MKTVNIANAEELLLSRGKTLPDDVSFEEDEDEEEFDS